MREIQLTRGHVALVDDEDYDRVGHLRWHAQPNGGSVYAVRKTRREGHVAMHRLVLDAPHDCFVDHINGNGLDNRRQNLRLATRRQNQFNRGATRRNRSGFKGVEHNGHSWVVRVGGFSSAEEAARAYDLVAPLAHGEFVRLNFPDGAVAA